ncbi:MAG: hypothetical protein WA294_00810 [Acidobacteriaceae bacterium]
MRDPIQLSGAFDSLEAMMQAGADAAVRLAAEDHGMTLDYSPESVARLETVLAARTPVPDSELESATRLWGAYFGEVFRRRYSGEWIMAVYPRQPGAEQLGPDADVAMPALDIAGSHIYPLLKVSRRLTLGPSEDLASFYAKVSAALDARQGRESNRAG